MKWLPRTLLSRLMLLIALLLAVGQYAAFKLFDYFELEPRASAIAIQAVSVVNLTQAALLAASEERRLPLLKELSQKEGVRVYPVELLEQIEPLPNDALSQKVASKIHAMLGPSTFITYNHLGLNGLWVSFPIDDDEYWVVIPNARIERPFPMQWLGWALLILLFSMLGAYLITTKINQPLRSLAQAAAQVAKGEFPPHVPEVGTEEFQHVNHAFNSMTESLARLDAERTLLLAGISHDLRTPLARLRLAVEMMPEDEMLKSGMVQDIEDMDKIIGQFLDFVRGIEGESPQPTDLAQIVAEIAARYQRSGRNISLECPAVSEIMARPQALHRLITNLVDNAFKYGSDHVEIGLSAQDHDVLLKISDRGPGIPEAEIPRLLRPFERMDQARGNASGSGLGLAIADRIARLHGGNLHIRNREGGGLEVIAQLPV
jgi:two-component system osmolarity sensor histidine kinase EnvZ